jgi:hypothetical protein
MTKYHALPYLPTMFASCMLLMVLYTLCVALWAAFPELQGHALLSELIPQFRFLDAANFLYGLIMSAIYGWGVAIAFVFFYNLWAGVARILFRQAPKAVA